MRLNFLLYFLATYPHQLEGRVIKVFENLLETSARKSLGGATLLSPSSNDNETFVSAFTMCFRLRMKVMGSPGNSGRGVLVAIGES